MPNYQKFHTLDSISRAIYYAGVFVAVLAVVGFIFALIQGAGLAVAFGGLIGTAVTAILLFAFGELIQCFLAIEQNTRRTLEALQRQTASPQEAPAKTEAPPETKNPERMD